MFFSAAKLGGSDSPSIRPGDGRGSAEQHCKFEFLCCQVGGLDSLSIRPSEEQGSVEQYCKFESYSLRQLVLASTRLSGKREAAGKIPAIPRGFGRDLRATRTGDFGGAAIRRPRPTVFSVAGWGGSGSRNRSRAGA